MSIKITECPRDAMQGVEPWIPTEKKIEYINKLLRVGFDTIDFGSFVSPKAIPQLKDTAEVLHGLDLNDTKSKLLAIVANRRGAESAGQFEQISFVGYPFSISETFQMRNTNSTIDQSLSRVEEIVNVAHGANQKVLIYISMAFGNPYEDPWSSELACTWVDRLHSELGISHFAMADTIGVGNESSIADLFKTVIDQFSELHIGAHLHSNPSDSAKKISAAFEAGCRAFDVAINGLGGCPMAEDELVGNISTQALFSTLSQENFSGIDLDSFSEAVEISRTVFP